jgi:A/G-specific adenine glycosylase
MAQFPTPAALAAATPADAIRAWSGLGYNRRALHLWRAATLIVERYGGQVPRRLEELLSLPGVGAYTARAVAAISFRSPVAAVDTNVRRVVLRLYGETDPGVAQPLADGLVDPDAPDRWTHAVMDIGATICRPGSPRCTDCPLQSWCAFASGQERSARGGRDERIAVKVRPAPEPFEQTSRWLRGRIVDRLRDDPAGAWTRIEGPMGSHDRAAVGRAVDGLVADGLLDAAPDGRVRLSAGRATEVAAEVAA